MRGAAAVGGGARAEFMTYLPAPLYVGRRLRVPPV
jgi:hypothetical protein